MDSASLFNAIDAHSTSFHSEDSFDLLGDYNLDFDFADLFFPELDLHFDSLQPPFPERHATPFQACFSDHEANGPPSIQEWSVPASNTPTEPGDQLLSQYDDDDGRNLFETDGYPPICLSEESIQAQDSLENNESRSDLKRKWQDSVIVFSSKDDKKIAQKRRRAYSPSRRRTVALNRIIGACTQCKLRKGPCNFGLPCDHCVKRAGSVMLAREICTRQSLVSLRFDSIDLFRVAYFDEQVRVRGLQTLAGSQRNVYLGFQPLCEQDNADAYIELPALDHPNESSTGEIILYSYYKAEKVLVPCLPATIVWNSLPSLGRLIQSYKVSRANLLTSMSPFADLKKAVESFARRYCTIAGEMPLKNLVRKILDLDQMFGIYRAMLTVKESLDSPHRKVTFHATTIQFKWLISRQIVQPEAEILSEIDRLVSSSDKIGRDKPIAFWVCLWTMLLSYKNHILYHKAGLYTHSDLAFAEEQQVYELCRHIFNNLISIYSALYKTTSPLALDWRTEEVSEMLGNDAELIRLFCDIKTEMFWFYAGKDKLFSEDALFKILVVENENKLLAAHRKAAQKRGIL